jgi:hypothetical protein
LAVHQHLEAGFIQLLRHGRSSPSAAPLHRVRAFVTAPLDIPVAAAIFS